MNPSWIVRLPATLFAIPVGLFGLAGAWHRAVGFGWRLAADISDTLLSVTFVLWSALLVLYACKCVRHPQQVKQEFLHPVQGPLLALVPLSVLLVVIALGEADSAPWLALALLALALQGVITTRMVSLLATGQLPAAAVTPALYMPPVGGGFVGGMALNALHYPGWGALLFGMGLVGWALLEMRVLNRLFEGSLPLALRPTIGIELAPPTIATLTVACLWPGLPGEILVIGLGLAAGPLLTVLARYRWWSQVPFAAGFWSFSFPLANMSSVVVEVVRRAGWPPLVATSALLLASAVIVFLALRTLGILFQGKLLPALPQ